MITPEEITAEQMKQIMGDTIYSGASLIVPEYWQI